MWMGSLMSIFILFRAVKVGILMTIQIEIVQRYSLATVNLIPELAGKLVLVKEGSIGADKTSSSRTIATIIAHSVRLTSRLRVCIHSWPVGHRGTAELGVGSFC